MAGLDPKTRQRHLCVMLRKLLLALFAAGSPIAAPAQLFGTGSDQGLDIPQGLESVALVDGWQVDADTRIAALAITLRPGWHTYWRSPGSVGIPPRFDWSGSENVDRVEPLWPVPGIFELGGISYLAYTGRFVLPLRIELADANAPVRLALKLDFGVCAEICVPTTREVSAMLGARAGTGPEAEAIRAALANQPRQADEAGVADIACRLRPAGEALEFEAEMALPQNGISPEYVAVEAPVEDLWIPPAAIARDGRRMTASTRMEYFGTGPLALDRSRLRLTLIGQGQAVEINGCPVEAG